MSPTVYFIWILILAIAVYDIYIIIKQGKYESISAYIIRGSKKYPLLVLALGITLGHLFWSMDTFDYLEREELIQRCMHFLAEHKG